MLGVLVMEVVLLADNSIKLICPKCYQVARVTSKYTLLMCGRCRCDMELAPSCNFRRHKGYRPYDTPGCADYPTGC